VTAARKSAVNVHAPAHLLHRYVAWRSRSTRTAPQPAFSRTPPPFSLFIHCKHGLALFSPTLRLPRFSRYRHAIPRLPLYGERTVQAARRGGDSSTRGRQDLSGGRQQRAAPISGVKEHRRLQHLIPGRDKNWRDHSDTWFACLLPLQGKSLHAHTAAAADFTVSTSCSCTAPAELPGLQRWLRTSRIRAWTMGGRVRDGSRKRAAPHLPGTTTCALFLRVVKAPTAPLPLRGLCCEQQDLRLPATPTTSPCAVTQRGNMRRWTVPRLLPSTPRHIPCQLFLPGIARWCLLLHAHHTTTVWAGGRRRLGQPGYALGGPGRTFHRRPPGGAFARG